MEKLGELMRRSLWDAVTRGSRARRSDLDSILLQAAWARCSCVISSSSILLSYTKHGRRFPLSDPASEFPCS